MAWVRLDDGFAQHPKIVGLSDPAFRALVTMLCYAAQYLTDGCIPKAVGQRFGADVLDELVATGLLESDEQRYIIHDFLDYNLSSDTWEKMRQTKAAAGRKGAATRWQNNGTTDDKSHSTRDGKLIAEPDPVPEPDLNLNPQESTSTPPPPSALDDVGFKSFWEQYPKRNGKKIGKAKTASSWKRLSKEQRERALIAVGHYADACNQGLTLAKDPERFLKADFFEDWLTPAQPRSVNGQAESVPDYVNVTGT